MIITIKYDEALFNCTIARISIHLTQRCLHSLRNIVLATRGRQFLGQQGDVHVMFVAVPELLGETKLAAEEVGFELLDLLVAVAIFRSNL